MPDADERRLPKWPLRLALSLVLVLEIFFVVMLFVEGAAGNIPMTVNSVGLIVFCVLTWRGVLWSRWLLIALLVWRVAHIAAMVSSFAPGDQRTGGSLLLVVLYVVAGLLVASPLGRPRMCAAT